MKAITFTQYGPPDVLHLDEVEQPAPNANDVLIKVHVATLSPADIAARTGKPWFARLAFGLTKPKKQILGSEFAGVVEAVGAKVSRFKVGDEVYGASGDDFGCHAEYVRMAEDEAIVAKPSSLPDEIAAALGDGALTALPFLRDLGKIQTGQDVLINGASGAVGSSAVQVAKVLGATVTGVCGTSSVEMVQSLGPDHVIDYRKDDFTSGDQRYDIVFDAVGKSTFTRCRRILKPGGVYLRTVPSIALLLQMAWTSKFGVKKAAIGFMGLRKAPDRRKDLQLLAEWFGDGKLRPVIDRRFSLEQFAEAHEYVGSERKKGNVLLLMQASS